MTTQVACFWGPGLANLPVGVLGAPVNATPPAVTNGIQQQAFGPNNGTGATPILFTVDPTAWSQFVQTQRGIALTTGPSPILVAQN